MPVLVNDPDRDWEVLGREDPYYAVLSDDRYRAGRLSPEAVAEFFESGEEYVRTILEIVDAQLVPGFAPSRALDFGCGVGRLLIPLARRCDVATGVDVAEAMLAEARRNCAARGIENVHLVRGDDRLAGAAGSYDFVHSYIVFQHIPVRRGERITRELVARLAPGGVGVLHYTYRHAHGTGRRLLGWMRARVPLANAALNLAKGRSPAAPVMQGNEYSVTRLIDTLAAAGCGHVYARFSDHQGVRGVMLFFQKADVPRFL
jgi:SAM-dependent methyltransferase